MNVINTYFKPHLLLKGIIYSKAFDKTRANIVLNKLSTAILSIVVNGQLNR